MASEISPTLAFFFFRKNDKIANRLLFARALNIFSNSFSFINLILLLFAYSRELDHRGVLDGELI